MSDLISQIFQALNTPLGSIVYHIVLVFSIASALQSAFNNWRSSEFPQARRTLVGLGLLLLAQFFLFVISGLGWQGLLNLNTSLPPIDRAFTLFGIIWITWLWAFPEPSRPADAAAILVSLLVGAAMGLGLLTWPPQSSTTAYNATLDDLLWQVATLGFILLGALILFIRRPNGFGNGLAVLTLALLGHAGRFVFAEQGNYSGIVRLAYMAGYPILLTLPQRFPAPASQTKAKPANVKQDASQTERRRYGADPKTFHALLALAAESGASKISNAITRAIAQAMLSDLCFLMYLTDNKNQVVIASGYDLIREENLEGGSFNKNLVPMLTNALQRGRPLRMPASSTSTDIKGLGDLLGLQDPGHLLSVPIVTPDKDPMGGVLLLSPYSNRIWTAEDQSFLTNIASSLVPIIQRSQKVAKLEQIGEQSRQAVDTAQLQIDDLQRQNDQLVQQLQALNLQSEQNTADSQTAASLMAALEESQQTVEQLQMELGAARDASQTRYSPQAEQDLQASIKEMSRLQKQLAESNARVVEFENRAGTTLNKPNEQAEVIASITQELRQPMSSIIGYTDLLLGESVGILGALQRKFVERIKASTERMGSMIDDMIQVSTLQTGKLEINPQAVDLNQIIDNAMAYTSSQVREKNISLHLDLPKKVAPLKADREALQQILIHLLQNAGAASPIEGTIRLKVQTTNEQNQDYVMIQVTDSGGGIPPEDLPRVFTRLYRADNVLIQGVGDTGVGLSIAKTLTESQHGRIWVESEAGIGATFSVLLPISKDGLEGAVKKGKK